MELDNTTLQSTVQAVTKVQLCSHRYRRTKKQRHSEAKYRLLMLMCNFARYSVCRLDTVKQCVSSEYKGMSVLTCQEL